MEGQEDTFVDAELKLRRPALYREISSSSEIMRRRLSYDEYLAWQRVGLDIARGGFRASEAALEYFRSSVALSSRLRSFQLSQWWRLGQSLVDLSPALAAAYFRSSPLVLGPLLLDELELWIGGARRLFKDSWRMQELAAQFVDASPALCQLLSVEELSALAELIAVLSQQSIDTASATLEEVETPLGKLQARDRLRVIKTAIVLAQHNAKAARAFLEAAPAVLARFSLSQRAVLLDLVADCGRQSPDRALRLFLQGAEALSRIDSAAVSQLLVWSSELGQRSGNAAVELLLASPELLPDLGLDQLERWMRQGIVALSVSDDAGLAYFRLESQRSRLAVSALSHVCDLESVKPVLRLYCKGLCGRDLSVAGTPELVGKAIGWASTCQATSDGTAIYLPVRVEQFHSREKNFAYYKVLATHQAAHIEFGSYDYPCLREAPGLLAAFGGVVDEGEELAAGHLERLFDRFADRALAKHIYVILEDGRVDAAVLREYRGIRGPYRGAQLEALRHRPIPLNLPLRQACIELLLRLSLHQQEKLDHHGLPMRLTSPLVETSRALWCKPGSTIADTAEATIRLYHLLHSVPNVLIEAGRLAVESDALDVVDELLHLARSGEMPFAGPDDVDYRGSMKPELVAALMKVRGHDSVDDDGQGTPISPELLRRLLEKNLDVELAGLSAGDVENSLGLFVNNILRDRGKSVPAKPRKQRQRKEQSQQRDRALGVLEAIELRSYYYDEWDFRTCDYRTKWCRLSEQLVKEGELDYYHRTVQDHAPLVRKLRQQFELLRPEAFRRIRRLEDGEDFELDAVVEAIVELRSGHTPSDKVFWRRNRVQRDVAVAFVLDMSASTDEEIDEIKRNPWDDNPKPRGKRIIDVEKESLVLLTQALEAIGDRYGIYGFSGYGRDNCEFYIVKELGEEFGDRVKRRIDKIVPVRGTRMGVAIRHATAKLEAEEARLRILMLLSDGYPQDHDYYGKHQSERDYALHDTKAALLEAKRKNIVPFCMTVDKSGHDYLKTMCAEIGYEIVNDVRNLPRRLPALYRALTT